MTMEVKLPKRPAESTRMNLTPRRIAAGLEPLRDVAQLDSCLAAVHGRAC